MNKVPKIFISYSHKDNSGRGTHWVDELKKYLAGFKFGAQIDFTLWDDTKINAGANWFDEIQKNLLEADIIILMVSNNYIASEFIQKNEFAVAIEQAHKSRKILFTIHIETVFLIPDILNKFQSANDPKFPLKSFSGDNRNKEWKSVIEKFQPITTSGSSSHGNDDKIRNIHIITSTKGGVGKTLIGLGITSFYCSDDNNNPLIIVDMNTMNQDLYEILDFGEEPKAINQLAEWFYSDIHKNCTTVRLQAPHAHYLHKGASSYWQNIRSISNSLNKIKTYDDLNPDILVDTNLNAASLIDEDTSKQIESLSKGISGKIYMWFFWTWAAFKKSEPYLRMAPHANNNIVFVHVINPSAMLQPQVDSRELETLLEYANVTHASITTRIERLKQLEEEIDRAQNIKNENLAKQLMIEAETIQTSAIEFTKQINTTFSQMQDLNQKPFSFDGLEQLARSTPNKAIEFNKFVEIMREILEEIKFELIDNPLRTKFNALAEKLQGKTPSHLFVVAKYDPKLKGYTEKLLVTGVKSMDEIRPHLGSISSEIGIMLAKINQDS